jgi:hypothetical protein
MEPKEPSPTPHTPPCETVNLAVRHVVLRVATLAMGACEPPPAPP